MSRIGKAPITLPEGIELKVGADNVVSVKGPKGELTQAVDRDLKVKVESGVATIERPTEQKRHKAMHGIYRTLISNMIEGVSNGYKVDLELVGVGYRAQIQGRILDLTVGYSHNVLFELPVEVKASVESKKGQNPKISLESADKQLLGHILNFP